MEWCCGSCQALFKWLGYMIVNRISEFNRKEKYSIALFILHCICCDKLQCYFFFSLSLCALTSALQHCSEVNFMCSVLHWSAVKHEILIMQLRLSGVWVKLKGLMLRWMYLSMLWYVSIKNIPKRELMFNVHQYMLFNSKVLIWLIPNNQFYKTILTFEICYI